MPSYGKVAIVVVVGNEDGAHHTAAEISRRSTEVGFTIAAGGVTYWVGEAMGSKEYKEFRQAAEGDRTVEQDARVEHRPSCRAAEEGELSRHQGRSLSVLPGRYLFAAQRRSWWSRMTRACAATPPKS